MDQFYFQEGYLEAGYYTIIREAESAVTVTASLSAAVIIADATGYYIPDYIAVDYFVGGGATIDATGEWSSLFTQTAQATRIQQVQSSQSAVFTQSSLVGRQQSAVIDITSAFTPTLTVDAFKNHTAILEVATTMTSAGAVNRSANVLLDHIADLNAMAAKTAVSSATMAATATQITSAFATKPTSATLSSSSSLTINAGKLKTVDAQFITGTAVFARGYVRFQRPWLIESLINSPIIDTSNKKFGAGSLSAGPQSASSSVKYYAADVLDQNSIIIDFWVYITSLNGGTVFTYGPNTGTQFITITHTNGNFGVSVNGTNFPGGTSGINLNSWNHVAIAVEKNDERLAVFTNGTRTTNRLSQRIWSYPTGTKRCVISSANNRLIDEFRIKVIAGNLFGTEYRNATITVPTSPARNDSDTVFLAHYDTNFEDDISVIHSMAASLVSTATLSAQANANTKQAASGLTSTATVAVSGSKLQQAASTLTSAFSQTAVINKFRSFQSDLESSATVTAVIGVVKQFNISVDALFAPSIDIDAQLAGVALLESEFTQSTSAVKTTDAVSNIQAVASQSATATVTAGLASALSSNTALTSTVTRIQQVSAALTGQFAIIINNSAIEQYAASVSSEFACTVVADRFARYSATLSSAFTQDTQAKRTRDLASALTSNTAIAATVIRQQQGTSDLASAFTQSTNAVKDTDVVATLLVQVTQTTTVAKTVNPQTEFSSIGTQLTAAFKNATGTITLESTATVTAVVGQLVDIGLFTSGLDTTVGQRYIAAPPDSPDDNNLITISFWAKRDTLTGGYRSNIVRQQSNNGVTSIVEFVDRDSVVIGSTAIYFTNAIYINSPFAGQVGAYWQNAVPNDTLWHHYLIRNVRSNVGGGTRQNWSVWIDGQLKTMNNPAPNGISVFGGFWNGIAYIGSSGTYDSFNTSLDDESFDGAMAQFWGGHINVEEFAVDKFYNDGPVDLGPTGRGLDNQLPSPEVYNLLNQPWLGVTNITEVSPPLTAASEPLYNANVKARATLVVGITTAVFLVSNQTVSTSLVCNAVKRIDSTLNITAVCTSTAVITQTIGIVSALTSTATVSATAFRIKQFESTQTTQATLTVVIGATEQFDADLVSQFTIEVDIVVRPPIRTQAFLESTTSLIADAASFTDTTTLMASLGTLTADVTVIPPIRVEADLVAQTTLTVIIGTIEQFAVLTVSAGTMTTNAVKRTGAQGQLTARATVVCEARKFTGIILTLTAFNTQLTLGDVINLDPALTYVIPQETREYPILPESRLYVIQGESRELIILQG